MGSQGAFFRVEFVGLMAIVLWSGLGRTIVAPYRVYVSDG